MRKLDYLWRLFATGFSFFAFGVGGWLASLTLFMVLRLWPMSKVQRRQRGQHLVHLLFRFFVWMMSRLGVLTFSVNGAEQLVNARGAVVLANHPSLLDVVLLISVMPRANCVVKDSLRQNPFMRGIISAAGYIGNDMDGERMLAHCQDVLDEGDNLIIFPEGTRSEPGKPVQLHRGAAQIAVRCRAPVIPAIIRCSPTTLTKAERWYQIPPRRVHYSIVVLPDIEYGASSVVLGGGRIARALTRQIQEEFNRTLELT